MIATGECGLGEGGKGGWKMGTKRDFAWGDVCTRQCADEVLLSCALEACMVL